MEKQKILEQAAKFANENWKVLEKPNEHDNAREDFIAGAMWALKNLIPRHDSIRQSTDVELQGAAKAIGLD